MPCYKHKVGCHLNFHDPDVGKTQSYSCSNLGTGFESDFMSLRDDLDLNLVKNLLHSNMCWIYCLCFFKNF
jgi:hypothetical protein